MDLYFNQHKSYAEIAQIEHISPRDIHTIIKEEEARRLQYKHQQQEEDLSAQAYELFSQGKTPLQVAISLKIRQSVATKYYREYWKLRGIHMLNLIYKETNGKLGPFLKLYRLIKEKGMSIEQVANAVEIAIHNLPHMESLYEQVKDQVDKMQRTIQRLENYSHTLNDEIASAKALLNSYHLLCERKRKEAENLNNELSRLEALVSWFKSNNEEYRKIKQRAEEEVRSVLTDGKVLLQFALASVIEALRRNPDKYNNLLVRNTESSTLGQDSLSSHIEGYKDAILEAADELYDRLLKYFTKSIMDNAVAASSFNPTLSLPSSSSFLGSYNQIDIYRKEEPESFHNSKGDIADWYNSCSTSFFCNIH